MSAARPHPQKDSAMTRTLLTLAGTTALLSLLHATNARADTGARILVQGFDPTRPDVELVHEVYRDPRIVSGQVQGAWTQASPQICAALVSRMSAPGAAAGQTLRDIACALDPGIATKVVPRGPDGFDVELVTGGSVTATSTTPTPLGEYADPRLTLDVRAHLTMGIGVQQDRNRILRVTSTQFRLQDARLRPENWSAAIAEFIAADLIPYFGGPNYKRLAEQAVNDVKLGVMQQMDDGLQPLNVALAERLPSDFLRIAMSGADDMIALAVIPRPLKPPGNGTMRGAIAWNPAEFNPASGCQSFSVSARVQTGPTPLWSNEGPPMLETGAFTAKPDGADRCTFVVTGLAADWPNHIAARIIDGSGGRGGSVLYSVNYALEGAGWDGRVLVPRPEAEGRDFVVARTVGGAWVENVAKALERDPVRENPRINPADIVQGAPRRADRVVLNPQPLPPAPPDPTQRATSRPGTAIIGAGGRTAATTSKVVRERAQEEVPDPR